MALWLPADIVVVSGLPPPSLVSDIVTITKDSYDVQSHQGVPAEVKVSRVEVGGVSAVLLMPPKPVASLILLTGGPGKVGIAPDGSVTAGGGNQLVRTRDAYAAKGFAVLVPDVGYDLSALVSSMG